MDGKDAPDRYSERENFYAIRNGDYIVVGFDLRVGIWIKLGEVSEVTNAILKAAGLEYAITMRQIGVPNGTIDGE